MTFSISRRLAIAGAGSILVASTARAATGDAEREIVDKARLTVDALRADRSTAGINVLLPRAKGVLICPALHKAGFIFGAEAGSGVLLGRGADGSWSAPAFYSLGSGSIGLLAGYENSEVIFVVMTEKGLEEMIKSQMKIGASASIAAGPRGEGVSAATTVSTGTDIYSYARSKGAYLGASFDGTVISSRAARNEAYYGKPASTRDIVIGRKFTSTYARWLQGALSRPTPIA